MAKRLIINDNDKSVTVRLRNVRLSFPSLFEPKSFDGDEKNAKYQATFISEKEGDPNKNADLIKEGIKEVVRMAFGGKAPGKDRVCLRDGADKEELDGYDESVYFTSSNNSKRVPVVDRDMTQLDASDGKPYAGCYVNATIQLWAQDNKYGKRVNASLRAVQFFGDGEPFGSGGANVEDEFEDCSVSGDSESEGEDEDWL